MKKVFLKSGREKLPKSKNPLVFSGAVMKTERPETGDIVEVVDFKGDFIAYGHWNDSARIALRLLEWNSDIIPDKSWLKAKIVTAIEKRKNIIKQNITNICKLISSESDMLSGVNADLFGEGVILSIVSPGMEKAKHFIAETILEILPDIKWVYERSNSPERTEEGLEPSIVILAGECYKNEQEIVENGLKFKANCEIQKYGFYTEYRSIREKVKGYSNNKNVLDACCFCGEFSVYALSGGAKTVTLCDVSKSVLDRAKRNIALNDFDVDKAKFNRDDIFSFFRKTREKNKTFSLIILDPPPFVENRLEASKWMKTYKDLNMSAMNILEKDGILVTFCRDDSITPEMFRETVAYASKDSFSDITILDQLHQNDDYPIRISAPETEFLKGFILQKN